MRAIFSLVVTATICLAAPAWALEDVDVFNTALRDYIDSVDRMIKQAKTVSTAAHFAGLLENFAADNERLAAAMSRFLEKNPEAKAMKTAPPEMTATMERLEKMGGRMSNASSVFDSIGKKYAHSSAVEAAVAKVRKSLRSVQAAGE